MPCIDDIGNICNYKVNLRLYSIAMPAVTEFTALKNAQRIYGQYGICISFVTGQSLLLKPAEQAQLKSVSGSCGWELTSDDQRLLHSQRGDYMNSPFDIRLYFVNEIVEADGSKLNGCGGHAPGRPALNIASTGTPWTFAHELGHVLLGKNFRPVHMEADKTNIMHSPTGNITSNPPTLTPAQVTAIKSSPYCRKCEETSTPAYWVTQPRKQGIDFFK